MGITAFSTQLLSEALQHVRPHKVCELGSQNLYDKEYKELPYTNGWYEAKGIEYSCIDLNEENNAVPVDLETQECRLEKVEMVTDFGTSEHIRDYYNVWRYKHQLCMQGGLIISENPKIGNWPEHGFHYLTKEFYKELAGKMGYEIINLGEHPAMGNDTDGWNVYCILKKTVEKDFIEEDVFNKLKFHQE